MNGADFVLAGIDPLSIAISVAISIALSLAAQALQKKPRTKNQRVDDSPTMTATRGEAIPPLLGRDRVGPVVGWAGNRKWFSFSEGAVATEDGWHELVVGPAARLHAIRSAGAIVWRGPISIESHPSGSQIDIPGEGSFRIYWGEPGQPVDPLLAAVLGVASRWPNLCHVVWIGRNIGSLAQWPLHDYDVEVRPLPSVELVGSSSWYPGTVSTDRDRFWQVRWELSNAAEDIIAVSTPEPFATADLRQHVYAPGGQVRIEESNFAPDGEYTVLSIGPVYNSVFGPHQDVKLAFDVPAFVALTGKLYARVEAEDDGANPAHILWQLLFAKPPHGRALPTKLFDIKSLESIGIEADIERLPSHVLISNGEDMRAIIAQVLLDLGCLIPFDPRIGKWRFVMVREPAKGEVIAIPSGALLDPIPEVVTNHGLGQVTCPTFVFKDRLRSYRDETVPRSDDGATLDEGFCRSERVEMILPRDAVTAARFASRREQEVLGQISTHVVEVNRNARDIIAGDVILLPESIGFPGALRVFRVKPTPLSSRVRLGCALDAYGAGAGDVFDQDGDEGGGEVTEPAADLAVRPLELPSFLSPDVIAVVVARVRANTATQYAEQWLSADGAIYRLAVTEVVSAAAGQLLDDLGADTSHVLATGPEITPLGPSEDLDALPDFRDDLFSWRSGQLAAIINQELFFVRNVVAVSPSVYRLDGLIRARYDSLPGSHQSGDRVYIVALQALQRITDTLFAPGVTRYLKSLPRTYRTLPLDEVEATTFALGGKAIKPLAVTALRAPAVAGRLYAYAAGDDVPLAWCYRSKYGLANRTGAGMQGFGRVSGQTIPDGTFRVEIIDDSQGSIVRVVSGLTAAAYTYTDAQIVSDFGDRPQSFRVRVRERVAGYDSAPADLVLQRIDL